MAERIMNILKTSWIQPVISIKTHHRDIFSFLGCYVCVVSLWNPCVFDIQSTLQFALATLQVLSSHRCPRQNSTPSVKLSCWLKSSVKRSCQQLEKCNYKLTKSSRDNTVPKSSCQEVCVMERKALLLSHSPTGWRSSRQKAGDQDLHLLSSVG